MTMKRLLTNKRAKTIFIWGSVVLLVMITVVVGASLIAHNQTDVLPAPTGNAAVGRVTYDWVDPQRIDPLANTANEHRKLAIWIWYPARITPHSPAAPYVPSTWKNAQQQSTGIVQIFSTRSGTLGHSYTGVPLAPTTTPYPVLVMQPGLGPSIPDYTVFAENLASHGYVVVGINETDSSNLVVFTDGQIAHATPKGSIADSASATAATAQAAAIGQVWTDDARFVLNRVQALANDPSSLFFQHLDLAHIGFWGHSLGGASALSLCQTDSRCKAGADVDGTPFGDGATTPMHQPFLFLTSQGCRQHTGCQQLQQSYDHATTSAYFISINGAEHFNFSNIPLHFTIVGGFILRRMGVIGSIDPVRALAIANAYLVAFFDRYLKNGNSPLLTSFHPYPEVQFASK